MLKYKKLSKILSKVHDRFTYISDIEKYGENEHWVSFKDIPKGKFSGDCEDFAQAIRKELYTRDEMSRLATCGINSSIANHCVVIYDDWVMDNIHGFPMRKSDLINYKFISISGFRSGDNWMKIL